MDARDERKHRQEVHGALEARPAPADVLSKLNAYYGPGMAFVAVPGPYDFALSTERFRAFGVDRATVWHEGGLHRVLDGVETRIEPAEGGVDVEPLADVSHLLGFGFDLAAFSEWA